jgi:adenylosuccinate lyase
MIPRYSRPEMSRIWDPENRYSKWLEVEIAVAEAQARRGWIPKKAVAVIKGKAKIRVRRIDAIEKKVKHDVIAFLTAVGETVGPESRFLHYGLTSYDVVDTALGLLLKEASDVLIADAKLLLKAIRKQARRYKNVPMAGRTHSVHAEVITFGLKLCSWHEETKRNLVRLERARESVAVGKISGAVGTYAHLDPAIEKEVCRRLGLSPDPISTQIVQRDRHADFILALAQFATSLEKFATEIRHLQRTEVGEVEEPFSKGQKGSSAMPHKKNPIVSENVSGLARVMRGYALTALENNPLWHERDISNSSVERIILPDASILMNYLIHRMIYLVENMVVHPDKMRSNLDLTGGLIHSETVMLALAQKGLRREEAYEIVQRHAMKARETGETLLERLLAAPEVRKKLSEEEIRRAFDHRHALRWTDTIYRRLFGRKRK